MFPPEIDTTDILHALELIPHIDVVCVVLNRVPITLVAVRNPDTYNEVSNLLYQNPDFRFSQSDLPLSSGRG